MINFFETMTSSEFVFWMIAIPSTLFFGMQMILTFLVGELDVETDTDVDGMPFEMFTLRNAVAFLTVFSWTGIICLENSFSLPSALTISVLSGLVMVLILSSLFYFMSKLAQDNDIKQSDSIGREATVYLKIPAMGTGKINVMFGGARREVVATSIIEIPTGATVRVVGEQAGILLVEPLITEL